MSVWPPFEPLGLLHGDAARRAVADGAAWPLAGGRMAFTTARMTADGAARPVAALPGTFRESLAAPAPWTGLPDRPLVMGILNVTPDSFSDGGREGEAVETGLRLVAEGADILDIGGESTRPGAAPISPEAERARILPVIAALRGAGAPISVDTRHACTMRAAVAAGAAIVNDVSALGYDPEALETVAALECPVVLMHMRGTPQTMGDHASYEDVAADVTRELGRAVEWAVAAGIARARIAVDPGFGFAKRGADNVRLLDGLPMLLHLGCRILAGASRKGFIGELTGETTPARRDPGSLAAHLLALERGASILRVHDGRGAAQAVAVWRGMREGWPP